MKTEATTRTTTIELNTIERIACAGKATQQKEEVEDV